MQILWLAREDNFCSLKRQQTGEMVYHAVRPLFVGIMFLIRSFQACNAGGGLLPLSIMAIGIVFIEGNNSYSIYSYRVARLFLSCIVSTWNAGS